MSRSLFIGRWQPFHDGHKALIDEVLKEGNPVLIAVRDTPISVNNPYSAADRLQYIQSLYKGDPRVEVIIIPDIREVCYGRDVGWGVRRIRLPEELEKISATKIRNSRKRVVWLTGNVGAGKTSLALLLRERMNGVMLDGDEMRASISRDLGFSKKDRETHNMRVARLAQLLHTQGHNVIVSVIAPFRSSRAKITRLIDPFWIYIRGGKIGEKMPYEVPRRPHIIVDPSRETLEQSLERIVSRVSDIKPLVLEHPKRTRKNR